MPDLRLVIRSLAFVLGLNAIIFGIEFLGIAGEISDFVEKNMLWLLPSLMALGVMGLVLWVVFEKRRSRR